MIYNKVNTTYIIKKTSVIISIAEVFPFEVCYIHLLSVDLLYAILYNNDKMEECFMDIVKVFGTNLKKYRIQKGLSQEKFAEKCGLHRTYISDIECFRRSISLENIQRIADALEIETYLLFVE